MMNEKIMYKKCKWHVSFDEVWASDCGLLWEFNDNGTPEQNEVYYCPKCGKKVEEIQEVEN